MNNCSYKIWLYAGISHVSHTTRSSIANSKNVLSGDNPQERIDYYMEDKNMQHQWLKKIRLETGNYLAGFVDGEGSFNVSFRKRDDHRIGWQVILTFNVSQKDKTVLVLIKKHLGCGKIRTRRDGLYYFAVADYRVIQERIIPFFERFGFLSAKSKKIFSIFKRINKIVNSGQHLTREGLKEIIELREKLNEGRGRKRKYNKKDINY